MVSCSKRCRTQRGASGTVYRGYLFDPGTGCGRLSSTAPGNNDSGFSGYATVEQDFDNRIDDEVRKLRYLAECSKQSVKYLRVLAEQIDDAGGNPSIGA